MLPAQQLTEMLDLQKKINEKINADWIGANNAWLRAVMHESAEAGDHWGWKWWKKQTPDISQVQMELVDIWNFVLSYALVKFGGSTSGAASYLQVAPGPDQLAISFDGKSHALADMDLIEKLDLMTGLAAAKRFEVALFQDIMHECKMDGAMLYRQYMGKSVLNFFRQDHGYKTGEYRKTYPDGREDNVHLIEVLEAISSDSNNIANDIYSELADRYCMRRHLGRDGDPLAINYLAGGDPSADIIDKL